LIDPIGSLCRYDFQFYNRKRIEELFAKENATVGPRKDLNTKIKASSGAASPSGRHARRANCLSWRCGHAM